MINYFLGTKIYKKMIANGAAPSGLHIWIYPGAVLALCDASNLIVPPPSKKSDRLMYGFPVFSLSKSNSNQFLPLQVSEQCCVLLNECFSLNKVLFFVYLCTFLNTNRRYGTHLGFRFNLISPPHSTFFLFCCFAAFSCECCEQSPENQHLKKQKTHCFMKISEKTRCVLNF